MSLAFISLPSLFSPPTAPLSLMDKWWPLSSLFVSGVNLLIGTDNGMVLLDRSGEGKVYPLISRKRFQQMDVQESQNILVCIAGMTPYYYDFLGQLGVKN